MKKRVADIVVETLIELKIEECFCVVGGGAMHLNNAFEINEDMCITFCHHEQACAFAAEGYAKYSGKMAVVSVTSGPGCINTLNGVYSAWVDSTPMIVIAGHPRQDTTIEACGLNLRSRGVQEYDVIPTVKGMTKYAITIKDPYEIKKEIIKACTIAMTGRKGPVWISIPLDIQAAMVETKKLSTYVEARTYVEKIDLTCVIKKLQKAKRPCILTGAGLRYGNAMNEFLEFLKKIQIPIVGGALLADILPENFPLFFGSSGNVGLRAGNYILQNADLILVLGNSLSTRQTGFNVAGFAPNAYFIMIDVEKDEAYKPGLHIDMPICMEISDFLIKINNKLDNVIIAEKDWINYCNKIYDFFDNYDDAICQKEDRIPAKYFCKRIREYLPSNAIVALGNSNGIVGLLQYGIKKMGQRVLTNYNAGSMGYDLPEAIGAAVASKRTVYCLTGDGSIMMNLQELETIIYNKLPIKIIIFSNKAYGAIRQTCKNFFNGVYTGCDVHTGIDFPDFEKVSKAFGYKYIHCKNCYEVDKKIKQFLEDEDRIIMEVDQRLDDPVLPKLMSKVKDDGTFEEPNFIDMFPYVTEEELEQIKQMSLI